MAPRIQVSGELKWATCRDHQQKVAAVVLVNCARQKSKLSGSACDDEPRPDSRWWWLSIADACAVVEREGDHDG
jgi:hypothetical protein